MSTPRRFTHGVTNVASDKPFGQFFAMDPTRVYNYFNDFFTYNSSDWNITETQAGATQSLADGNGGFLLLTNSAADNDLVALQLANQNFTLISGKKLWFTCKFQVSDVTQSDFILGIYATDTSPIASAPSDGVYFRKDDGDTNIDFEVRKSSLQVAGVASIGTAVDATNIQLDFYFDGIKTIHYFVDEVEVGTVETTGFPTAALSVSFALQNGEAVSKTMAIDWIGTFRER